MLFVDQKIRFDLIMDQIVNEEGINILEVGCGIGLLSEAISNRGFKVVASEIDFNDAIATRDRGLTVVCADGTALPFRGRQFDFVISSDVLEHVPPAKREKLISELLRALKPKGKLIMTVFLHNTFAFKLFGVLHLLFSRVLPPWYLEHLAIPLPKHNYIAGCLRKNARILITKKYQGLVNLTAFAIQHVGLPGKGKVSKCWQIIQYLDLLGRKTSCLYVVERELDSDLMELPILESNQGRSTLEQV